MKQRRAHSVDEVPSILILYAERYPLNANKTKGAIGFDREVRIKEACRGLLTRKQAELNTTADSFEYALAA